MAISFSHNETIIIAVIKHGLKCFGAKILVRCHTRTSLFQIYVTEDILGCLTKHKEQVLDQLLDSHAKVKRAQLAGAHWRSRKVVCADVFTRIALHFHPLCVRSFMMYVS